MVDLHSGSANEIVLLSGAGGVLTAGDRVAEILGLKYPPPRPLTIVLWVFRSWNSCQVIFRHASSGRDTRD